MDARFAAAFLALALAVGASAAPDSVPYWRDQLRSPDADARVAAADGLALSGRLAIPAVPELAAALRDVDPSVRQAAATALRSIGRPAAAAGPLLARALAVETSAPARQAMSRALARLGSDASEATPALLDALDSDIVDARRLACRGLADVAPPSRRVVERLLDVMLRDPDSRVRDAARSALAEMGVEMQAHVPRLVEALGDRDPAVRENAVVRLAEMRPRPREAVDPLLDRMLDDPVLDVRQASERTLRKMGTAASSAVPRLLVAMQDADRERRSDAASVLGAVSLGADADIDALVAAAVQDAELSVRLSARGALVRMVRTNPAVFERFAQVAGSPGPPEARVAMIDALGRLGADAAAAVPRIMVALRDGPEDVRAEAAHALGRIGAPAFDALLPLRRVAAWDRSQRVRDSAERSIKLIRAAVAREQEDAPLSPAG